MMVVGKYGRNEQVRQSGNAAAEGEHAMEHPPSYRGARNLRSWAAVDNLAELASTKEKPGGTAVRIGETMLNW
jgi:hypothetical protein